MFKIFVVDKNGLTAQCGMRLHAQFFASGPELGQRRAAAGPERAHRRASRDPAAAQGTLGRRRARSQAGLGAPARRPWLRRGKAQGRLERWRSAERGPAVGDGAHERIFLGAQDFKTLLACLLALASPKAGAESRSKSLLARVFLLNKWKNLERIRLVNPGST